MELRERLPEAQVVSGVPLSTAEAEGALGVIALETGSGVETEAIRSALARAVPVFATPAVQAACGADGLEVGVADDCVPEWTQSLGPPLEHLGVRVNPLGPMDGPARSRWPWTVGQRPLAKLLRRAGLGSSAARSAQLEGLARDLGALGKTDADFLFLGSISWRYRHQRPQHLSAELGRHGKRVVYVEPDFLPEADPQPYRLEESPEDNVFCASLRAPGVIDIHRRPPSAEEVRVLTENLLRLCNAVSVARPTLILHAPFWLPIGQALPHRQLVYDCMDLYRAFPNVAADMGTLEEELLRSADLVVFTAENLREQTPVGSRSAIIRNGCEFGRFAGARPLRVSDRVRVGYVGAIDRWFDVDLLNRCVESRPEWDFVLAGSYAGLHTGAFRARPNLHLLGEIDYGDVPELVAGFDVCLVPFVEGDLTRCVNPVKVYEYLAAGKPVVATPLPELQLLPPGLVHLARPGPEFLEALPRAVAERDDHALASRRQEWAARQTWGARAEELLRVLAG